MHKFTSWPQVLLELAAWAADEPGIAWRVGVGPSPHESLLHTDLHASTANLKLRGKAKELLARQCKPAVSVRQIRAGLSMRHSSGLKVTCVTSNSGH
jgi:hypothetical protein